MRQYYYSHHADDSHDLLRLSIQLKHWRFLILATLTIRQTANFTRYTLGRHNYSTLIFLNPHVGIM